MDFLLTKPEENTNSDVLAKAICLLFHPLLLGLVTLFVTDYLTYSSVSHSLYWTGIVAGFTMLMGAFYIVQLNRKKASDFANIAEIRPQLYLVAFVVSLTILALFYGLNAPTSLIACTITGAVLVMLAGISNKIFVRTPISAIACGSSFATALVMPFWTLAVALLGVMVLTGWARNRVNGHTWQEIVIAWALSIPTTYILITLLLRYMA